MKYSVLQEELHSCLHVDYDFHLEKLKNNFILDLHRCLSNLDISKIIKDKSYIRYLTYMWADDDDRFFFRRWKDAELQQDDIYFLLTKYKYPYNKYHAIEVIDDAIERYITKCDRELREMFIAQNGYDPEEPPEVIVLYDFQNTEDILFSMTTENYGFLEDHPELE